MNYLGPDYSLKIFSETDMKQIYEEALAILERTGCLFEAEDARKILLDNGAVAGPGRQILFPRIMVEKALKTVPDRLTLYDTYGEPVVFMEGENTYFDMGGTAVRWLEEDGTQRPTLACDQVTTAKLQQGLPNLHIQSILNVHMDDVPDIIGDTFGLYLCCKHCSKPMVIPSIQPGALKRTYRLLCALAGGANVLAEKPMGYVCITPTSPLIWSDLASTSVIEAARYKLPVEFISAPLPGAGAPATLAGTVLLATVENLAGIVLSQVVWPGQPIIFGCAPMCFDMSSMNPLPTSVESSMVIMGIAQMGKFLGMPTQAYAGMADSKQLDLQAGWEDATSALLPLLSGVNALSGVGQLEFLLVGSPEKMVAMNDLIGMLLRLKRGITVNEETLATKLIEKVGPGGDYLKQKHTLKWFRKESYFPSKIVDRSTRRPDAVDHELNFIQRATAEKKRILAKQPDRLDFPTYEKFEQTMIEIIAEMGYTGKLPFEPGQS